MNPEELKNLLNQLLENDRALKNELQERKKEQAEINQKMNLLMQKLSEEKQPVTTLNQEDIKKLLNQETEKVIRQLQPFLFFKNKSKGWTLFADGFKAHNFKIVFETVCKWMAILLGGFYLLHSILNIWK